MTPPSKYFRFKLFIAELQKHAPASNREEAVSFMKKIMNDIENRYNLPKNDYITRMHVFGLDCNMGWKDLDSDPCYWDDMEKKNHRTYVYNNGRIVIKNIKVSPELIVLDKPGA
ncbi:hypothetical protein [Enterobacter cloacae]|uniref:hypothetical protein n=1 Tax=Enterobacter cloacae TaxID=550 RepID=UPI0040414CCE